MAPATVSGYRSGGRRYASRLGAKTCLRADQPRSTDLLLSGSPNEDNHRVEFND